MHVFIIFALIAYGVPIIIWGVCKLIKLCYRSAARAALWLYVWCEGNLLRR
jgi:hypothetical protein